MDRKKALIKLYVCLLTYSTALVAGVYPVPKLLVAAAVGAGVTLLVLSKNRARIFFGLTWPVVILISCIIEDNYFVDGVARGGASMFLTMNAIFSLFCTVMVSMIEFKRTSGS